MVTCQLFYGSTAELLYGSALLYNLRVLERQWGTRKFASFIFTTYTLTLGSHFLGYYFDFAKMVLPFTESLASGLYGPIFALLFFFVRDVHSSSVINQSNFSISNKWFTYFIAFRMMMVSKKSYVAAILGLLSGVAWSCNFLYLRKWIFVPNFISNMVQSVYEWFRVDEEKPAYRRTLYGATEDIQDDMMYDFMTRMQTTRRANSRLQMGQGYADTLQPADGPMQEFLNNVGIYTGDGENPQPMGNVHQRNRENGESVSFQYADDDASEEDKIQRLIEMGFTRDAVIQALHNSGHDVQSATNALLSQ